MTLYYRLRTLSTAIAVAGILFAAVRMYQHRVYMLNERNSIMVMEGITMDELEKTKFLKSYCEERKSSYLQRGIVEAATDFDKQIDYYAKRAGKLASKVRVYRQWRSQIEYTISHPWLATPPEPQIPETEPGYGAFID